MLELVRNRPYKIPIPFDTNVDGKADTDVVEVVFSLQKEPGNSDDMYLLKRMSNGGITYDSANKKYIVNIDQADYANLTAGTYVPIFGIMYTGDTAFREIQLVNKNALKTRITEIKVKDSWLQITS